LYIAVRKGLKGRLSLFLWDIEAEVPGAGGRAYPSSGVRARHARVMDRTMASANSTTVTTYRVDARVVRAGTATGTLKDREIEFDTSRTGDPDVPGPAELLALAFAACLLKNVERFSHLLSFDYDGASVAVTAQRQESPPRFTAFRYELRIRTNEEPHRVALLHRNLQRFGTVYNTLAASCDVEGEIVAGPNVTDAFERPPADPLRSQTCC
jgi:uncharacterized OsmC-like protein